MELNDDFMSLQKFKDNEKALFEHLDAGIKGTLSITVLSSRTSRLIALTPAQIQVVKSAYPNKVKINLETETLTHFSEWMGRSSSQIINRAQILSYADLWVKKSETESVFKKPPKHTLVNETEKSTMLKLILGMAMGVYGFQPGDARNTATGSNKGSIKADLQKLGLSIDEDTVRKYLNEAAAMYPDSQIKSKNKIL